MINGFVLNHIPDVSVIIVNFNGKEHLENCFNSIASLNFPKEHLEVIMVDNCSSDGSVEFVSSKFPWVKILKNSSNVGFAKAVNQGAESSKGEYVAFLNNDTHVDRDWLTQLLLVILSSSEIVCSCSKILDWEGKVIDFIGGHLSFYGHGFKVDVNSSSVNKYAEERPVLFPCGGAMLVEKRIFLESGGFDEDYFAFFEDVDFGWRLWVLGYKVFFAPKSIVYHRHHGTASKFGYEKERFLLERNALFTLMKNYDDERFERIFPVAALLALKRGLVEAGLNIDSYKIGNTVTEKEVVSEQIPRITASHLLAIDEVFKNMPSVMKKRDLVQSKRKKSDTEILRLFGEPFRPNISDPEYVNTQESLIENLEIRNMFERKSRVLIISNDIIGERMAGPAIRCWEFANILSREHEVILAIPNSSQLTSPYFALKRYNRKVLKELVEWCDVFICQGFILHHFPFLKNSGKPIVVDIYDPFTIEMLELFKYKEFNEREVLNSANLEVLNDQLLVGDFFICASEKQRDYWIGMLCSLNRINPYTYDRDKTLRNFIDIVPFGLPARRPSHTKNVLKGVNPKIHNSDKLILWGGGIYNWFDPITLIKAIYKIVQKRKDVKLYFLGLKHPNPDVPEMKMCLDAIKLSEDLGLKDEYVFFNYGWVPYNERENYLLEADIGVSTHLEHVETSFSFRTRILDYLWTNLPIICTSGDSMGDLVEKRKLGITVGPESVDELESAILGLLDNSVLYETAKNNINEVIPLFTWDEVLKPLNNFCKAPTLAPDKTIKGKLRGLSESINISKEKKTLWYYFKRSIVHFRNEGFKGVSFHGRNLVYRTLKQEETVLKERQE